MSEAELVLEYTLEEIVAGFDAMVKETNPLGLAISLELQQRQNWQISKIQMAAEKVRTKTEMMNQLLADFQKKKEVEDGSRA